MNPSQLVEVYNAWEEKKTEQATIFIESTRGNQRGGTRDKTKKSLRKINVPTMKRRDMEERMPKT